jgi:hypothetical protein
LIERLRTENPEMLVHCDDLIVDVLNDFKAQRRVVEN